MLGLIIPMEVSLYLKMYAFIHDLTVSQIMRSVISQWQTNNKTTKNDLIHSITDKMNKDWKDQTRGISKDNFLTEWKKTLQDSLNDEGLVSEIIQAYINKYEFIR